MQTDNWLQRFEARLPGLKNATLIEYVRYGMSVFSVFVVLLFVILSTFPVFRMTLFEAQQHYKTIFSTSLSGGSFLTVLVCVFLVIEVTASTVLITKNVFYKDDKMTTSNVFFLVNLHIALGIVFWVQGWPWAAFGVVLAAAVLQGLSYLDLMDWVASKIWKTATITEAPAVELRMRNRMKRPTKQDDHNSSQETNEQEPPITSIFAYVFFYVPRVCILAYLISISQEMAFGAYVQHEDPIVPGMLPDHQVGGWNQDKWFSLNQALIALFVIIFSALKHDPLLPGFLGVQLFTQYEYLRREASTHAWYFCLVIAFIYMVFSVLMGITRLLLKTQ